MAKYTNFDLRTFIAENKNTEAKEVQKEELDITAEETVSELDGAGSVDALTALIGAGGLAGGAVALSKLIDSLEDGKFGDRGKAVAKFLRDAGKTFSGQGAPMKENEDTDYSVELLVPSVAYDVESGELADSPHAFATEDEIESGEADVTTYTDGQELDAWVFSNDYDQAMDFAKRYPELIKINSGNTVAEKKGKDHDGDGDIDGDDYMAAKDKAIKKAMGKEVNETSDYVSLAKQTFDGNPRVVLTHGDPNSIRSDKPMHGLSLKLALNYIRNNADASAIENGDVYAEVGPDEVLRITIGDQEFDIQKAMGKEVNESSDYVSFAMQHLGDENTPVVLTHGFNRYDEKIHKTTLGKALAFIRKNADASAIENGDVMVDGGQGEVRINIGDQEFDIKKAMGKEVNEIGMFHDPIGYDSNAAAEDKRALEFIKSLIEKGVDRDTAIKKAGKEFKLRTSYLQKKMNADSQIKEAVKTLIRKALTEEALNEAATGNLSKFSDDYADFAGMTQIINQLENLVTEVEGFYAKTGEKLQKIFDAVGNVTNEEGLKVGGFIAPAIESAFKKDIQPVVKKGFMNSVQIPTIKQITQGEIDQFKSQGMAEEEMEEKQTMFTPVMESKNK